MYNLIIVGQLVNKVDHFCLRVDVVPDYRLTIVGSMSKSFGHSAYMVVNV